MCRIARLPSLLILSSLLSANLLLVVIMLSSFWLFASHSLSLPTVCDDTIPVARWPRHCLESLMFPAAAILFVLGYLALAKRRAVPSFVTSYHEPCSTEIIVPSLECPPETRDAYMWLCSLSFQHTKLSSCSLEIHGGTG